MADAHDAVVRGRCLEPLVHIRVQFHAEIDMRLCVADGEDIKLFYDASLTMKRWLPLRSWATPSMVTGPLMTFASTEMPEPFFP